VELAKTCEAKAVEKTNVAINGSTPPAGYKKREKKPWVAAGLDELL
jgi:hypothetical protein